MSNIQIPEHSFYDTYGYEELDIESISVEWFEHLDKIIKCYKKNGVELILVCAPLSEGLLVSLNNYYDYHNLTKRIVEKEGLTFWDFNLCKEDFS